VKKHILLLFAFLFFSFSFKAQIIITVAGNHAAGYTGDGGPAISAELWQPSGTAVDASGNIFIADATNNCIRKVNSSGIITTVAGNGTSVFSGDGGPAISAGMYYPTSVAFDAAGNLFIAASGDCRIRKVDASGIITTVAGSGVFGYSGDGGQAILAAIKQPQAIAFDANGNLYIADATNRIRKIDSSTNIITTIAGNGTQGFAGDGGPSTAAVLYAPYGLAFDAADNLYIADWGNNAVRMINTSGIISTVAGDTTAGYSGDGGPATAASLHSPYSVAFDAAGNMYISDYQNYAIRKVNTSGIISTFAGGAFGYG